MRFGKLTAVIALTAFIIGILTALPVAAAPAGESAGDISGVTGDCTWSYFDGVLTIAGEGKMEDYGTDYSRSKENTTPWKNLVKNISKIVIRNGVKSIGKSAFTDCTNLNTVEIPPSLELSEAYAFYNCKNIKKVCVNDIGAWCRIRFVTRFVYHWGSDFSSTEEHVYDPSSNPLNGADLYLNKERVTDLVIPEGVTELKYRSFSGCKSIESVTIPSTLKKIDQRVFEDCKNIKRINLTNVAAWCGVEMPITSTSETNYSVHHSEYSDYDDYSDYGSSVSYSYCYDYSLLKDRDLYVNGVPATHLVIPEGVTDIARIAFYGCNNIESVTMPTTLKSCGWMAFDKCKNLKSVHIKDISKWCGVDFAYTLISGKKLTFDSEGEEKYVDEYTYNYFCNPLNTHDLYVDGKLVENLVIPNNVTEVKDAAFRGCMSIKTIAVPDGNVTIGHFVFQNCFNLYSFTMNGGGTVKKGAFSGCSALENIKYGGNKNIELEPRAFAHCPMLYSALIPANVTSIGREAFSDNTVLTIYGYKGTIAEAYAKNYNHKFSPLDGACPGCGAALEANELEFKNDHKAPTCTEKGLTSSLICKRCSAVVVRQRTIPAKGHQTVTEKGKEATCTEPGVTDYIYCEVCGEVIQAAEEIPAIGSHDIVTRPGYAPSCTYYGLSDELYCQMCKQIIQQHELIPPLGHQPVYDIDTPATCTHDGLASGTHCGICGKHLSSQSAVIPKKGHNFETVPGTPATAFYPGLTDGIQCTECGLWKEKQEVIPALGTTVRGDVDGDGKVTIDDATLIQKYLAKFVYFNKLQANAADLSGDGTVSITDATLIQKYLAKMIDRL